MSELQPVTEGTRTWACYDCGKCTATCPITRAGADYSPRRHVLATNLAKDGEINRDESLFACLTCSLCDSRCPAEVGYTQLVQKLRERAFVRLARKAGGWGFAEVSLIFDNADLVALVRDYLTAQGMFVNADTPTRTASPLTWRARSSASEMTSR